MEEKKPNLILSKPIFDVLKSVANKDEKEAWQCVEMLYYYMIESKEPDQNDLIKNIVFRALKAMMDEGKKRYENCIANGKKGGRPPKEQTNPEVITPEVINQEVTTQEVTNPEQITQYLQDVSKATNLTIERLNYYKGRFDAHCRASNKMHKNFDDWKKHFYAWLNKVPRTQEEKETDKAKKHNADWQEYAMQRLQDRNNPEDLPDVLKDL